MITIFDLVTLAKAGANYQWGYAIGAIDNPAAMKHAILMENAEDELTTIEKFLKHPRNKGIANLPASTIYKLNYLKKKNI
jgi:hypothetical protein